MEKRESEVKDLFSRALVRPRVCVFGRTGAGSRVRPETPVAFAIIGIEDDVNLYAHVDNDPLSRINPFGCDACPVGDKNCIEDRSTEIQDQASPGGHPVTEDQLKIDEVVQQGMEAGTASRLFLREGNGSEFYFSDAESVLST